MNDKPVTYQQFIAAQNTLEEIKECQIRKGTSYSSRNYSFDKIQELIPERDRINIDEYLRVSQISDTKTIENLEKNIYDIENLIEKIESSNNIKLTHLISEYGIENIITETERSNDLLTFLLINGYLDENYDEYINYFYPGALKPSDKAFLISIQSQKPLKPEYSLNEIKEIIEEIPNNSFSRKEILNFNLLDFMLKNSILYKSKLDLFFKQLSNESVSSVEFCTNFLKKTDYKETFIKKLCNNWIGIWKYVKKNCDDEIKKLYLYNILKYVSLSNIEKINNEESLSDYMSLENDFISNFEVSHIEKIKQILLNLNVKFENINNNDIDTELGKFIIKNNFYKINKNMINLILEKKYKISNEEITNKNYSSILKTNDSDFIQYIKNNIEEYVEQVYLLSENNLKDEIDDIIDIINNEDVLVEHKHEIIKRQETQIVCIENINNSIWKNILEEDKMLITWNNIICYFAKNGFSIELINYINNKKETLSATKIEKYNYDTEVYEKFNKDLILQEEINEELLNCIDYDLPTEILKNDIKSSRIQKIIEKNNIIVDKNTYELIQENYNELLIIFRENNINFFIDNMDALPYDEEEIEKILISENVENSNKILLINNLDNQIICTNEIYANKYIEIIESSSEKVTLSIQLMKSIINLVSSENGIKLLINQAENLNEEEFLEILDNFSYPYNAIRGQQIPKFEKNELNNVFIEVIKNKNISNVSSIGDKDSNYLVYKKRN